MADNRGVASMGPRKVEVQGIAYPTFELQDGPGVSPANVGALAAPRGDPEGRLDEHLRLRPAWSGRDGARGAHPRARDHRRGDRDGRVEYIKKGDLVLGPVQHRLQPLPHVQEATPGVPQRQPGPPGSAYGYVDMGGWVGGQAEYALVPYADWNL